MSPTMQLAPHTATYTPTSDAMDRHEYGITKNRKAASTGGGRAWSEDEEVYLLQTRLQKMPYKHIAAHLKKTELACRLHYHQLSHGSNRRKQRATSVSSGSSTTHSPVMQPTMPSSIRESTPRSVSPPGSSTSYAPHSPAPMQLPSIMGHEASPRLPAILPKPVCMTLPPPTASPTRGYPTPLPEPRSAALPSATFQSMSGSLPITPPLRLECPLPSAQSIVSHQHVDMNRLQSVYTAHRASFWAAVANDYGPGASPVALEQAWQNGACCNQQQASTPITPTSSPDNLDRDSYERPQDKTRISAILGIDANPRSPRERELVRRMEESRVGA
ncbi:hypothetical protein CSIM01_13749 [Colletotrichum simmondsii]|uniref:Myb-like domain-containing protein n=2 Tax=Colletotrichum acutatum species complex TaxID=2707335 RepID=A0A135RRR0_9PEZI|nr:hypothetical protein CSIM01_13749 [Colletotrichum simmondsii]KXH36527.1 hypothetical protein CNYM01_12883 [Colletotrichum nymphaeae SA-01]